MDFSWRRGKLKPRPFSFGEVIFLFFFLSSTSFFNQVDSVFRFFSRAFIIISFFVKNRKVVIIEI